MGFANIQGIEPIGEAEREALVKACQGNEWVRIGGFPWQDDPYLEEYPYEFAEARSADALAGFFACGNWAIRQGVVYGDLAFVQQVNGGDEWWIMKRDGDSWRGFESGAFKRAAENDRQSFDRDIASMRLATPFECRTLEYRLGDCAGGVAAAVVTESERSGAFASCEELTSNAIEAISADPKTAKAVITEGQANSASEASKRLALSVFRKANANKNEPLETRAKTSRLAARSLSDARMSARSLSAQPR